MKPKALSITSPLLERPYRHPSPPTIMPYGWWDGSWEKEDETWTYIQKNDWPLSASCTRDNANPSGRERYANAERIIQFRKDSLSFRLIGKSGGIQRIPRIPLFARKSDESMAGTQVTVWYTNRNGTTRKYKGSLYPSPYGKNFFLTMPKKGKKIQINWESPDWRDNAHWNNQRLAIGSKRNPIQVVWN